MIPFWTCETTEGLQPVVFQGKSLQLSLLWKVQQNGEWSLQAVVDFQGKFDCFSGQKTQALKCISSEPKTPKTPKIPQVDQNNLHPMTRRSLSQALERPTALHSNRLLASTCVSCFRPTDFLSTRLELEGPMRCITGNAAGVEKMILWGDIWSKVSWHQSFW